MEEEQLEKRNQTKVIKSEILQVLAQMLSEPFHEHITTARLAKEVGMPEITFLQYFSNKASMYESLIKFIEESLFTRINIIMKAQRSTLARCEHLLTLILVFSEQNPGLCRILTGEALVGESLEVYSRVTRFFDRIEVQIKQVLRESELREGIEIALPIAAAASMLLAIIEGRILQFVRSGFERSPTHEWSVQWDHLAKHLVLNHRRFML